MRPVFLIIIIISNLSLGYNVIRKNPFASLSDTLVTKQQAACDGDILMLECPAKTKISIQLVLYHRFLKFSKILLSMTTCPCWFHPAHHSQSKAIKSWGQGCQNFIKCRPHYQLLCYCIIYYITVVTGQPPAQLCVPPHPPSPGSTLQGRG